MSAFPTQKSIGANKEGTWIEETPGQSGMTLRDYFAAKAMQGIVTDTGWMGNTVSTLAGISYEVADAMMKEREV
jgi:hypothetical protein